MSIGSYMVCIYLEASSLYFGFSLVFHYNTSKPKASNTGSLVFDIVHQSKQHKTNVVGMCNLVDLISGRVLTM
jgi:hypothetical protein